MVVVTSRVHRRGRSAPFNDSVKPARIALTVGRQGGGAVHAVGQRAGILGCLRPPRPAREGPGSGCGVQGVGSGVWGGGPFRRGTRFDMPVGGKVG